MYLINLYFFMVLFSVVGYIAAYSCSNYDDWIPKGNNRTDLKCPKECSNIDPLESPVTREKCCVCRAKPCWAVTGQIELLQLEYIRRIGSSIVLGNHVALSASLRHNYGFLSVFPRNICGFQNIVEIVLTYNSISTIGNISCLKSLDTLDLSYNIIKRIERGSFVGLPNLRILKLNNNGLIDLEVFTLASENLWISIADFSFNALTEIDISNIVPENNFCEYDFTSNNIQEIVNMNNFALDINKTYHGGFVDLDKNSFTKFIDFSELGIDDITTLGKVMQFGFSFFDVKWDCDCHMEPFLELMEEHLNRIWPYYFNISCWNPPEYRGMNVHDFFVLKDKLDLLICNLTEKCPRYCNCYHQPKLDTIVVNCTSVRLTKLPNYMPDGQNLTILLSNNSINTLDNYDYMNRTFLLDMSNNSITTFADGALDLFDKSDITINLNNNKLTELPRDLQQFDPCSVALGKLTISCDCKDVWIIDWIRNKKADRCSNITEIFCSTSGGIISTLILSINDICEKDENSLYKILSIFFSVFIAVFILLASVMYTFRYEFFILKKGKFPGKSSAVQAIPIYDVFLSFNEENEDVLQWVTKKLEPMLKRAGYISFLSVRDSIPGTNRVDEIIQSINLSRHCIVVLCGSYLDEHWKCIEWEYIWKSYKRHQGKNIIIINFDQLESKEISDLKLRAFFRLSKDLDFANKKHSLFKDIRLRLGSPIQRNSKNRNTYDRNSNTRFVVVRPQNVELNFNVDETKI